MSNSSMTTSAPVVSSTTAAPSRRRRRVTDQMPIGPFGIPPFHAEATAALRFIGRGFSVALDPAKAIEVLGSAYPPEVDVHLPFPSIHRRHAVIRRPLAEGTTALFVERADPACAVGLLHGNYFIDESAEFPVRRSDRFRIGDVDVMCLGESAAGLEQPLAKYGASTHNAIDDLLKAVETFSPIVLEASTRTAHEVAELLHHGTQKRGRPFFVPGSLARRKGHVDALLREADCGTVFVREHVLAGAPEEFLSALLDKDDYHVWPIFVVDDLKSFWVRAGARSRARVLPHAPCYARVHAA